MVQKFSPVVNSLEALGDNMKFFADRFYRNVGVMALKAAIVGVEAAAVRTPVDTGLARSNWQLKDSKVTVLRPTYTPGKRKQGIDERSVYGSVVSAAKSAARSIRPEAVAGGRSVYVSNPTPYIGSLNAGTSPQNLDGNFDMIAVQLIEGYIASYLRSGSLLTKFDTV